MTPEEKARAILDAWPNIYMECDEDELAASIAQALSSAVAQEREECAKVAESYARQYMLCDASCKVSERIRARAREDKL